MADWGRKFWITFYGMTLLGSFGFYSMVMHVPVPESMAAAVATCVVAFCGGNAAATIASNVTASKQTVVNEQIKRDIQERRNTGDGTEDTP